MVWAFAWQDCSVYNSESIKKTKGKNCMLSNKTSSTWKANRTVSVWLLHCGQSSGGWWQNFQKIVTTVQVIGMSLYKRLKKKLHPGCSVSKTDKNT
jgi:hypothetical protein